MLLGSLRHLLSFQTLFTAFLGVAVWALFRDWESGLLLTLLLYIHEVGHILGALVRRMKIRQGPTFIPGLGAYVQVDEGESFVDNLFLYLSGPIIGALGALLLWWLGVRFGDLQMTWAGRLGLWINLSNLLPLLPFDGGRIIRLTGRAGMIAGLIGAVLIGLLTGHVGRGFIGVGLITTWQAIKQARYQPTLPFRQRLVVLGAYLLAGALLFGLYQQIPAVPMPPRTVNLVLQPLSWGALAYCALYLVSLLPIPWAMERPRLRYGALLLQGWPRLLLRPWRLLFVARLFAASLGGGPVEGQAEPPPSRSQGRWGRLQAELSRRAERAEPTTGEATAWAYDALARTQGRPAADAWLAELLPALLSAEPTLFDDLHQTLLQVGQEPAASTLRETILTQGWAPERLEPSLASSLALHLQQAGRSAEALPFARRAIDTDDLTSIIQFGRLCLELGALTDAEWAYKLALTLKRSPTVLLGMGEVFARQDLTNEALKLGQEAREKRITDYWDKDEPSEAEIDATLTRWQEESHPPGEQ